MKSAFSSSEVALPLSAEEGFTGLMGNSKASKDELPFLAEDIEEFSIDELLSVDSEGRCIITDHGHFGERPVHKCLLKQFESWLPCLPSSIFRMNL